MKDINMVQDKSNSRAKNSRAKNCNLKAFLYFHWLNENKKVTIMAHETDQPAAYITDVSAVKGAMTVEAAIILPILLCAFLSVVFLIKTVYTYELMQHALDATASEIASAGYIYHISGLRDIHDTVRDSLNNRSETFKDQIGSVFDSYQSIKDIRNDISDGLPGILDSSELLAEAGENFSGMLEDIDSMSASPVDELKNIACYIASGAFNDAKTPLFTSIVKLYIKKYLATETTVNLNERLKVLNIVKGFDGLDFSESSFLEDSGENIDIIVRYKVRLPLPVQFNTGLDFTQRVRAKAWLGGDESGGVLDGSIATASIWSLNNFQRGLKIRRLFGANLPSNFPVIAKFENGKVTMIKSMDWTAPTYQSGDNAFETLTGYINELASYKGQAKPWGSSGIIINKEEIISRELLLVIPQNQLSEANEKLLADMVKITPSLGVTLVVERYGTRITESSKEHKEENGEEKDEENGEASAEGMENEMVNLN